MPSLSTRPTSSSPWYTHITHYCITQWQGVLFFLAGVMRACSVVVMYPEAWRYVRERAVPAVSLVVFAAFHVLECGLRIPLLSTAPDITTRIQPFVFLVGYLVLLGIYVAPYGMERSSSVTRAIK